MVFRKNALVFGVILLIATIAALATYVLTDLFRPESVAVVVTPPTQSPPITPTVLFSPTTAVMPTTSPTETQRPAPIPQFGSITFGTGISGDRVLKPGSTFPAGTNEVYAVWSYQNMNDGMPYQMSWLLDDSPWLYESLTWDTNRYGSKGQVYVAQISEHDADGLPPGNYRLELFLGERLVQLATFVILGPPPTQPPPTPTPQPDMRVIGRRASRSLVSIWMEGTHVRSRGSGSIVHDSQGLILTNWHVVTDDQGKLINKEGYAWIFLTIDPDQAPVLTYWAQVLPKFSDPNNDLALLRITHWTVDNSSVQGPLDLPAIPLGDSSQVRRGDRVLLLGYPDYAEGTLSWTEDVVATRTDQWIKSGADASYGHSGGMMLNDRGELIGVITRGEAIGVEGQLALARPVNAATRLISSAIAEGQPLPSAPPEVAEPTGRYMVVLAAPSLNLRDGPSLDNRVLDDMPLGTTVEVLETPKWDGERFWYKIRVPDSGQVGWASEVYLASWETARTPILFTSNQAGSLDIYSIYPDGTGLIRLTSASGDEGDASWSPDRNYIVFTYSQNDDSDLYCMNIEDGSWIQLTNGPADDVHPVWSPDGNRIAFVSNRDGDWEIFLLDLNISTVQQLTNNQTWDSFPAWSPDSKWLVFTSRRTGNYDLFLVNTYSGEEIQLTSSPYSDAHPAWSPYGDKIVYTMVVAEGRKLLREIGMLNLYDPAHPWRVTKSNPQQALHRYPDWSPDGQWIVFESERDGNKEVYLIPARGGIMANLTSTSRSSDTAPAWSR